MQIINWQGRACKVRFAKGLDTLPEAKRIREEVFIKEQGFAEEFDDIDSKAKHCVIFVGGIPAATGRLYPDESEPFTAHIGRLAVIKGERGTGLGSLLISRLEILARADGFRKAILSAQCRAVGFYRANGYSTQGGIYYDEFCPHIMMYKEL